MISPLDPTGNRVLAVQPSLLFQGRCFSSANTEEATTQRNVDKHEFKAETRMLLDIVARSLYSENEVFVRELVSNASDALEKFRYTIQTAGEQQNHYENVDRPLEIHLETDKQASTLTIKDTGIGNSNLDQQKKHQIFIAMIFYLLLFVFVCGGRYDQR